MNAAQIKRAHTEAMAAIRKIADDSKLAIDYRRSEVGKMTQSALQEIAALEKQAIENIALKRADLQRQATIPLAPPAEQIAQATYIRSILYPQLFADKIAQRPETLGKAKSLWQTAIDTGDGAAMRVFFDQYRNNGDTAFFRKQLDASTEKLATPEQRKATAGLTTLDTEAKEIQAAAVLARGELQAATLTKDGLVIRRQTVATF